MGEEKEIQYVSYCKDDETVAPEEFDSIEAAAARFGYSVINSLRVIANDRHAVTCPETGKIHMLFNAEKKTNYVESEIGRRI